MTEDKKKNQITTYEHYSEPNITIKENPKFFITFPYCYMNGKLHLGHLFSLSKADFYSRYMELRGYNAFFPLAFHCTGMPISASALKLKQEIKENRTTEESTVFTILESFGFSKDIIPEFIDPQKWLDTFPELCRNTLLKFHANIDFTKSFITTDRNPYYDSFIQYQFKRLKKLECISFGKRYTIFDPATMQACLDHDRSVGEGVLPVSVDCMKVGIELAACVIFCCVRKNSKDQNYVVFRVDDIMICVDETTYLNIVHQVDGINIVKRISCIKDYSYDEIEEEMMGLEKLKIGNTALSKCISATFNHYSKDENFRLPESELMVINSQVENNEMNLIMTDNILRYYAPEKYVKSRSGAECVVSLMDQWFINYNDQVWKIKAKKCVRKMENLTEDTRNNLLLAIDWIQKWGCSRSFGLGSRLPFDKKYLIESLSDSTIYMAFYTFKDLLFSDYYGVDEILPVKYLCDELWECILNSKCENGELYNSTRMERYLNSLPTEISSIISNCQARFSHFYPNDIRFSGKDLTNNHLIFYIMNHVALFDEKYWPKRIFTNGHLLLNSQKMSKSTGNFMTADACIEKYGVSATRMTLAICGDGNEDANFIEENANSFVIRLHALIKILSGDHFEMVDSQSDQKDIAAEIIRKNSISFPENNYEKYEDQYLYESILYCLDHAISSYENIIFRDVIKYSLYEMLNARDTYILLHGDMNSDVMELWKNTIITLLYPIIPSLCQGLMNKNLNLKFINLDFSKNLCSFTLIKEIDYLKKIIKRIKFMTKKKKYILIRLGIGKDYSEIKKELIKCDGNMDEINKVLINIKGKDRSSYVLFAMDYHKNRDSYEPVDEMRVLGKCIEYLRRLFGCDIEYEYNDLGDPLAPIIEIN